MKSNLASLGFQGEVSDEQAAELLTMLEKVEGLPTEIDDKWVPELFGLFLSAMYIIWLIQVIQVMYIYMPLTWGPRRHLLPKPSLIHATFPHLGLLSGFSVSSLLSEYRFGIYRGVCLARFPSNLRSSVTVCTASPTCKRPVPGQAKRFSIHHHGGFPKFWFGIFWNDILSIPVPVPVGHLANGWWCDGFAQPCETACRRWQTSG